MFKKYEVICLKEKKYVKVICLKSIKSYVLKSLKVKSHMFKRYEVLCVKSIKSYV